MAELPTRPLPPRTRADAARAWVEWFGVGRAVGVTVAVAAVAGGGYLLLRTPPVPTEALLPVAASSTSVVAGAADAPAAVGATLPPPTPTPTGAVPSGTVVVHVAGGVRSPGVLQLPAGARVVDAVAAAGGPVPAAELDRINLAAPVVDGQQIHVPRKGEATVLPVTADPVPSASTPTGPVDLNRATADELEVLPGVGPATAAAIVEDRERHGPFATVDDLDRVPGIGPAKIAALRDAATT